MLTALAVALAVLCWPPVPSWSRGRPSERLRGFRPASLVTTPVVLVAVLATATAAGVAGRSPPAGAAAAAFAGTVALLARTARRRRAERSRRRALLQALDLLARDLASGTSLIASVDRVADVAPPAVRPLLKDVALQARFSRAAPPTGASNRIDAAVLSTFAVAGRHGSATADVLTAFAGTLRDDLDAAERHAAGTAGAQLSGWLLAALPLLGLAIGAGIGANPVPVLLHTGVGGALLVAGSVLCCAGLLWSARLAR